MVSQIPISFDVVRDQIEKIKFPKDSFMWRPMALSEILRVERSQTTRLDFHEVDTGSLKTSVSATNEMKSYRSVGRDLARTSMPFCL